MATPTTADTALIIQRMKALSDEKRLRILEQLAGGERCVCDLTDALLPALEAVFADLDARSDVDAIYHLGDLVGYAPWPDEVVQLLKDRAVPGIAGNYDSTTATD